MPGISVPPVMSVRVSVSVSMSLDDHLDACGRDARARHPLALEAVALQGKGAKSPLEVREREPKIDERAKHHVARGPRRTIEVHNPAHRMPLCFRLTKRPAPRMM